MKLGCFVFGFCFQVLAAKLVLFGGGDYSSLGVDQFKAWAGGDRGKYLIVTWASENPDQYQEDMEELGLPESNSEEAARPDTQIGRLVLAKQLHHATAIFFSGGDQNKVMDLFESSNESLQLLAELRKRVRSGLVYAGTSAGAALVSARMFTGDGDDSVFDGLAPLRPGLGLLPNNILIDQHFLRRQRYNRLLGRLVLDRKENVGIGIDEGACAAIDENKMRVLGSSFVLYARNTSKPGEVRLRFLHEGNALKFG